MSNIPGFWMHETGGDLGRAVRAYFADDRELSTNQIALLRAYVRQWIYADCWLGSDQLQSLRAGVNALDSRKELNGWLNGALEIGIDPF